MGTGVALPPDVLQLADLASLLLAARFDTSGSFFVDTYYHGFETHYWNTQSVALLSTQYITFVLSPFFQCNFS